jgi:uncharacterized membrane protein YjjP (DUF1212 family)
MCYLFSTEIPTRVQMHQVTFFLQLSLSACMLNTLQYSQQLGIIMIGRVTYICQHYFALELVIDMLNN